MQHIPFTYLVNRSLGNRDCVKCDTVNTDATVSRDVLLFLPCNKSTKIGQDSAPKDMDHATLSSPQ